LVGQIKWSPDGSLLLAKLTSGITVWTAEGVCNNHIDRRTAVHGVTWFASGGEFFSIKTNEVVYLDIHGHVIDQYPFERLQLHDIAITKNGERFLAVVTLEGSRDGYTPEKTRSEKRIVMYNKLEKVIERSVVMLMLRLFLLTLCYSQVPILQDVRNITLLHDGRFALASYEDKACCFLYKSTVYADPGSLRPLLSSGVLTWSRTKPTSSSLTRIGPTQRLNLPARVTLLGRTTRWCSARASVRFHLPGLRALYRD